MGHEKPPQLPLLEDLVKVIHGSVIGDWKSIQGNGRIFVGFMLLIDKNCTHEKFENPSSQNINNHHFDSRNARLKIWQSIIKKVFANNNIKIKTRAKELSGESKQICLLPLH